MECWQYCSYQTQIWKLEFVITFEIKSSLLGTRRNKLAGIVTMGLLSWQKLFGTKHSFPRRSLRRWLCGGGGMVILAFAAKTFMWVGDTRPHNKALMLCKKFIKGDRVMSVVLKIASSKWRLSWGLVFELVYYII